MFLSEISRLQTRLMPLAKEIGYRQASKSLHNYFFLKGLDQVREGGLIAFITSQGVMNAASPFIRMELVEKG